jgi:hypothetical protein
MLRVPKCMHLCRSMGPYDIVQNAYRFAGTFELDASETLATDDHFARLEPMGPAVRQTPLSAEVVLKLKTKGWQALPVVSINKQGKYSVKWKPVVDSSTPHICNNDTSECTHLLNCINPKF